MKLVVVGGVAAGMSTAARARRLDESAEIVVFERAHHVSFANCGLPYHIGETITDRDQLLLQTPESLREALNLDVRTHHDVLAIDPEQATVTVVNLETDEVFEMNYDALALCPGAQPFMPNVPGIDLDGIHVLRRIGDMDAIKAAVDGTEGNAPVKRAVVIGAGYIGLEMAENLHHRGVKVEIVEMADQIMPPLDPELTRGMENYLREYGIGLHLGTAAAAFTRGSDGSLRVELSNNVVLKTDMVMMSAGVRPNTELAVAAGLELGPRGGIKVDHHMQTSDPRIWAAGDAVETAHTVLPGSWLVPLAGPANRQGRVAAENICGRDTRYESTQGTSIVKVFDMVAGGTGASEKQLVAAGIPYEMVNLHPSGHAGYYPGTSKMHLKLLFAPETGRILGGQIVGFDGVDKRLDVMATAIRGGMTVFDLEHLELAYAPPFGSAKDPINMAGFLAANVIQGDVRLWYARDWPGVVEGAEVIDVRTPLEYDIWHIPGAVNVPLKTIREACQSWDRDRPLRVYCAVGFRSYLAYRALVGNGFTDVAMLSGGSTTFRAYHDVAPDESDSRSPLIAYAEEASFPTTTAGPKEVAASGVREEIDATGLACPGPVMALSKRMATLAPGDEVLIHVSDPGFKRDALAWAHSNGHLALEITPEGPGYAAVFRKGGVSVAAEQRLHKKSFVVFSGDFDKVLAAFILANGARAMGDEVTMFFTFWGLNALRRPDYHAHGKNAVEKMFSAMMPKGPEALNLSQLNLFGGGREMIKRIMKDNKVPSLSHLIESAQDDGVKLVACTMTMDLLGITPEELIDGVELGGVAHFLGEADESNQAMFI